MTFKKYFSALLLLILPSSMARLVLNSLGHKLSRNTRIGFSVVLVDRLVTGGDTRIGHLNFISCVRLSMRPNSYIGSMNIIRGPMSLCLQDKAAVGNRNQIVRARKPISYGPSRLSLGVMTKITAGHKIDCMRPVIFGDYSILAGTGSQIWSHGYYHESSGPGRIRLDGAVRIGNNVYIGSGCIVSMGIRIANAVTVGSHSSISKDLSKPGLYVSQPLRFIDSSVERALERLVPVTGHKLNERVYRKPGSN